MLQDLIFMFGGIILFFTLFPMFKRGFVAPLWTSVPIFIVMFVFCINAASLGLLLAAISYGATCLGWFFLAWFRH